MKNVTLVDALKGLLSFLHMNVRKTKVVSGVKSRYEVAVDGCMSTVETLDGSYHGRRYNTKACRMKCDVTLVDL